MIHRINNGPEIDEVILIPDVMFNSARLRRRNFYDELLNTLLRQNMQQVDSAVTFGVSCRFTPTNFSNKLFKNFPFSSLFQFYKYCSIQRDCKGGVIITKLVGCFTFN